MKDLIEIIREQPKTFYKYRIALQINIDSCKSDDIIFYRPERLNKGEAKKALQKCQRLIKDNLLNSYRIYLNIYLDNSPIYEISIKTNAMTY